MDLLHRVACVGPPARRPSCDPELSLLRENVHTVESQTITLWHGVLADIPAGFHTVVGKNGFDHRRANAPTILFQQLSDTLRPRGGVCRQSCFGYLLPTDFTEEPTFIVIGPANHVDAGHRLKVAWHPFHYPDFTPLVRHEEVEAAREGGTFQQVK